jgi:parvulin-like peptidyl-prolyl isomerase
MKICLALAAICFTSFAHFATCAENDNSTTIPQVDEAATSAALRQSKDLSQPSAVIASTTPSVSLEKGNDLNLTSGVKVLATYDGGSFTNEDLSATLALRRPRAVASLSMSQILNLPIDKVRDVVRDLVYERVLYENAKAAGFSEETTGIKERIQNYRKDVLSRLFYEKVVDKRLTEAREKEQHKFYEANKQKLYTAPGFTKVVEIFFSGYKSYVVKAGDTLKGIAKTQSGDEDAFKRILRDDGIHYPRYPINAATAPFEDVRPGEKLLVPLSEEELSSKTALAKSIREQVQNGASFAELAVKYSDAPPEMRETAFVPGPEMNADIREKINDSPTSLTELMHSKHGLHLFYISDRETTRSMSFEEVQYRIKLEPQSERLLVAKVREDLFDELSKKYNVTINTDALKRADDKGADPLTAETPIVTAPGLKYTLSDYQRDMAPTMKSWGSMSYADRLRLAKGNQTVLQYIVNKAAEDAGLDKTSQYEAEMRSKAVIEVTAEYLKSHPLFKPPTDAELRDYYSSHLDKYTSAATVTFREIVKRINPLLPPDQKAKAVAAAKSELTRIRAKIHSQADFEQFARTESEALGTRSRGGLAPSMKLDMRGDEFRKNVEALQPGEVSQPFAYGAEVVLIRLESRQPATPQPFEDVFNRVRSDYLRTEPAKNIAKERDRVLAEHGFKLNI